jgi:hypothetical protein
MKTNHFKKLSMINKGILGLLVFIPLVTSLLLAGCSFVDDEFLLTYPSDYEGVELWLDAGRGVTLANGTSNVTAWRDQSKNHVQFYVYSTSPTLSIYSGLPMIQTSGTGFLNSYNGIGISNRMTVMFVAYISVISSYILSSPSAGLPFAITVDASSNFLVYPGSPNVALSGAYTDKIHLFEFKVNMPDVKVTIDDGLYSYYNSGLSTFSLSQQINIGADPYGASASGVFLSEIIICSDKCSRESIDNIRNYLMEKYDIGN